MGRPRKWVDIDPESVIVDYALLGRDERAAETLKAFYDEAPYYQRFILREHLERAVALFAEARERNVRLGIHQR